MARGLRRKSSFQTRQAAIQTSLAFLASLRELFHNAGTCSSGHRQNAHYCGRSWGGSDLWLVFFLSISRILLTCAIGCRSPSKQNLHRGRSHLWFAFFSIRYPRQSSSAPSVVDPEAPTSTPSPNNTVHDTILLVLLLIMLVWPWIFFGVVWGKKGLQMGNRAAKVVTDHPHATSFFVTFIGNFVNLIVSVLFSFAIIRLAQERVMGEKDITVFDVSLLAALRHQSWPWGLKDLGYLFDRTRWLAAALVGGCIAAFTFVPGSTTSLINPAPYNRTDRLTGTELNFGSTAADCLTWLNAHNITNNCDWMVSWTHQ